MTIAWHMQFELCQQVKNKESQTHFNKMNIDLMNLCHQLPFIVMMVTVIMVKYERLFQKLTSIMVPLVFK